MKSAALDMYKQTHVETASPAQLVLMLFDGLIKNLVQAQENIRGKNIEGSHQNLLKAQAIVSELSSSLDMKAGGVISQNLKSLYEFVGQQLFEININKEESAIQSVIDLITPIRDAWQQSTVTDSPR